MKTELYAYRIDARPQRSKNDFLPMDNLYRPKPGGDVLDAIDKVLAVDQEWPPATHGPGEKDPRETVATVRGFTADPNDDRIRWGRVYVRRPAGDHQIELTDTGQEISVRNRDREGRPLFFWIVAPRSSPTVLLLTEKSGRFGIVSGFWRKHLIPGLREAFDHVKFDFEYHVRPVWDEWEDQGEAVEGAIFTRTLETVAEHDHQDAASNVETAGTMTTTLDLTTHPERHRFARILQRSASRDEEERMAARTEAIGIVAGDWADEISDGWDEAKLLLRMLGKRRTLLFGKERVPQLGRQVPDTMRSGDDGYPDPDQMAIFALEHAREIGRPFGIQ